MTSPLEPPSQIHLNPSAPQWRYRPAPSQIVPSPVLAFHRRLPHYAQTPLHSIPSIAADLGLGHVLLKDESARFGLPAFKILGASWAVYRAVAEKIGFDVFSPTAAGVELGEIGVLARERGLDVRIVTCTEGNWGRAVARMGRYLGVDVTVCVPSHMVEETREKISGEGADVVVVEGDYDDAALASRRRVEGGGGLLVMDISWRGYEVVPTWVVEGYQTMLDESDEQVLAVTGGRPATHAVVPCGCGSVAQAVTQNFKSDLREQNGAPAAAVIAVELDTAACLKLSLEKGEVSSVTTGDSIMCGMNCGTLSTTAWPVLELGVDACVAISDLQSHGAVEELDKLNIKAGPCGAATLAALKRACVTEKSKLGLNEKSVVVLYCTEGRREYITPS
ncbi:tryptophan synthase beta subunit-like PLP-dependent enzyme [Lasiosphaeris hirsuta]|uniref:Tryptophan synthase beta subunit-like PLP-dependent enzyme n=1 Tax=Lasiosphaeris hirsuta TaxID=260670 RepID=A0AA40BB10_9PEZI|nr:tryptophan synthase beta subunit-like PLP-dependent enzyme [Lasiosphaeris hirsuta]